MKGKTRLLYGLLAVFAAVFLFSAWKLFTIRSAYQKSSSSYDDLMREVMTTTAPAADQLQSADGSTDIIFWPQIDFSRLAEINPDVVGWLKIDDTLVDYPVAQGKDNWFYLEHLFNGEESFAGCLMLDCGNAKNYSDPNSVIYAHHLNDGSLFGQLELYREEGFYEAHPFGYLLTPDGNYLIRFFAGVLTDLDSQAWNLRFDEGNREEWIREAISKSCFSCDIVPNADENILTLSTCSDDAEEMRFVLLGVIEPQK